MIYKSFRFGVIWRVLALLATLIVGCFFLFKTTILLTTIFLFIAAGIQTWLLIKFTDHSNERLKRFFEAVRYQDFTRSIRMETEDKFLKDLNLEMNAVLDTFRSLRKEREEKELFLQAIVQQIPSGLVVFEKDGRVHLINTAFKRLFGIAGLPKMQDLPQDVFEVVMKVSADDPLLIKYLLNDEWLHIAVSITECRIGEQVFRILSARNIAQELDRKELESWHMLSRVLAHEIMNSLTPIVSLASSSIDALEQVDQSAAAREDAIRAIQTIERRGEGLMRFVNTYRSLTKIPKPKFSSVSIDSLFQDVSVLFRERLRGTPIEFEVINDVPNSSLMADPDLMQQVILNLLLNAADAVEGIAHPKIILRGQVGSDSRLTIEVEDNGKGILQEILDDIFIPFFTTKRTGSGIGLSLTRQILTLHGATIRANSQPGNKTVFIVRF